jgi:hypothetical protein
MNHAGNILYLSSLTLIKTGQKNLPDRKEHPNQNSYQRIHIHYSQNNNTPQKDCKCHGELDSEDRPRIAARLPPRKTVGSQPPRRSAKATKLAHFEQNRYSVGYDWACLCGGFHLTRPSVVHPPPVQMHLCIQESRGQN